MIKPSVKLFHEYIPYGLFLCFSVLLVLRLPSMGCRGGGGGGEGRGVLFVCVCSVCACLGLSVSSSS